MQNHRFISPLNSTFPYESPTGETFNTDTKYIRDRHYVSRPNIRGLGTTTSSLSLLLPKEIPPMSAPPRPSGTELSSPSSYLPRKRIHSSKIWKLFTRKPKVDNPRPENPPNSATASHNALVKRYKSTPDLKESWSNPIEDENLNSYYAPYHGFSPLPSASSAASFASTSSERDITGYPTIILVVDDNWDASSTDFPLQRLEQTIPVDITDEESSECSSLSTDYRHNPQYHAFGGQRRRADTIKSSRERWLKKPTHDPDASFLEMDIKPKSKVFWI